MKTLNDFKNDYAKENGYENWKDYEIEFSDFDTGSHFIGAMEIAAERYAEYMAVEFNSFIYNNCEEVDGGIRFKGKTCSVKELYDLFRQNKH